MNKEIIKRVGFTAEVKRSEAHKCATCGKTVLGFKDKISQTEYSISGMCQVCQDKIFGGYNEI